MDHDERARSEAMVSLLAHKVDLASCEATHPATCEKTGPQKVQSLGRHLYACHQEQYKASLQLLLLHQLPPSLGSEASDAMKGRRGQDARADAPVVGQSDYE